MCIVRWYNTMAFCTCPLLVHYGIVVNACRPIRAGCGALGQGWGDGSAGEQVGGCGDQVHVAHDAQRARGVRRLAARRARGEDACFTDGAAAPEAVAGRTAASE